jgi:hypothetical protein
MRQGGCPVIVTGKIGKGSDWLASAEDVVDEKLSEGDVGYEIDNATITLNGYDEDDSDALVIDALDLTNGGSGNNYYGTVTKTVTAAMTLGHTIRCEFIIDAGANRYLERTGWARVFLPVENLSR